MVVYPERFGQHLEQTLDLLMVRTPEDKSAIFGQLLAWDGKGMFGPEVERTIQGTRQPHGESLDFVFAWLPSLV